MQMLVADLVRTSPVHILWPLSLPFFAYLGLKGSFPILSWFAVIYFSRQMLYFLDLTFSFVQKYRLFLVPAQRLFETLDVAPEITFPENGVNLKSLQGNVEFNNVNFSYQKGLPVLNCINFSVARGGKLAIVGKSGAGKSTIANLILRLFDADSGEVRIDGRKISQINIDTLLPQIGVILQDTFLFGGTIRDNIRYGNPDASDEQVIDAAIAAGIHQDILKIPDGYDTDVAEGARLSGGQKQRIAIARALIKNPKLLILDEATSSLDITTEHKIIQTLRRVFQNVTTIMISHRISFIQDADFIIVLDHGKIIQQGNHQSLIKNEGLYRQLYQAQTKSVQGMTG